MLITSHIVTQERGPNTEDRDRYTLSSLARTYSHKFMRMALEEQKRLIRKQNDLRSTQEEMSTREGTDIFDMNYVFVRDKEDYIGAKILTRAVHTIFGSELARAAAELTKAENRSPNYFDVHRVRAFYYVTNEDYLAAGLAYNAALSLAPDRAPLRLWNGGFLSRNMGDQEGALSQLLQAERLAPSAVAVKLECARVMQYLRRFDEAEQRLTAIANI